MLYLKKKKHMTSCHPKHVYQSRSSSFLFPLQRQAVSYLDIYRQTFYVWGNCALRSYFQQRNEKKDRKQSSLSL